MGRKEGGEGRGVRWGGRRGERGEREEGSKVKREGRERERKKV